MEYKSCAWWPVGSYPAINDYSEDKHPTKEQAEGVITLLKRNGFGGDGKVFPIRTEIKEI